MKKTICYNDLKTWKEYKESLMQNMDDLGYPLRKEVKRNRYVLNARGFEEAVEKAVEQAVKQETEAITKWIDTEVLAMAEDNVQDILNNINVVNNNFVVKHTTPKKHTSNSSQFAERLIRAVAQSLGKILEDTIFPKGKH